MGKREKGPPFSTLPLSYPSLPILPKRNNKYWLARAVQVLTATTHECRVKMSAYQCNAMQSLTAPTGPTPCGARERVL